MYNEITRKTEHLISQAKYDEALEFIRSDEIVDKEMRGIMEMKYFNGFFGRCQLDKVMELYKELIPKVEDRPIYDFDITMEKIEAKLWKGRFNKMNKLLDVSEKILAKLDEKTEEYKMRDVKQNLYRGFAIWNTEGPSKVEPFMTRALKLSENINFDWGRAMSTAMLGSLLTLKDKEKGLEMRKEAFSIMREMDHTIGMNWVRSQIAHSYRSLNRFQEAEEAFKESLEFFERIDHKLWTSFSHQGIGLTYQDQGRTEIAMVHYNKAVSISEEVGVEPWIADAIYQLGSMNLDRMEFDESIKNYKKALSVYDRMEKDIDRAITHHAMGVTYKTKGDMNLAYQHLETAEAMFEKINDPYGQANSLCQIGETYKIMGDMNKAKDLVERSLQIRKELGFKQGIAISSQVLGCIHYERGDMKKSLKYTKESLKILEEIKANDLTVSRSHLQLLRVLTAKNDRKAAIKHLNRLEAIDQVSQYKAISQIHKLSRAIWLKTSDQKSDNTEAEKILRKLGDEKMSYEMKVKNQCLLSELVLADKTIQPRSIQYNEVLGHADRLNRMAEKRDSPLLYAETYAIRSRLALIDQDTTKSEDFYSKAIDISEKNGMERLVQKLNKYKA